MASERSTIVVSLAMALELSLANASAQQPMYCGQGQQGAYPQWGRLSRILPNTTNNDELSWAESPFHG